MSATNNEILNLTNRELEILGHISKGKTNKEIREELCISGYTLKYHIQNIYRKLGLHAVTKTENGTLRLKSALWYLKNIGGAVNESN